MLTNGLLLEQNELSSNVAAVAKQLESFLSFDDESKKKGIEEICENSSITPHELVELVDPFQSYLALHIWRHKD